MRRRAEAISGHLSLHEVEPKGTRVELAFRGDGRRPRMIV
jgi:nitrate/nitrite-specific signal transduction histidine kinase